MEIVDLNAEPDAIQRLYGHDRHRTDTGRPPVELCMVTSMDGSIAVDGRSGPLSGPDDRRVLATLRSRAGVILVGAGTVRDEGYTAPQPDGPLVAVVTSRGALDWDSPFVRSPRVVVITGHATDVPAGIATIRTPGSEVDLRASINQLAEQVDPRAFIHCEGGARLNAALAADDLIDVVNLTMSARIVGGSAPRLVDAPHQFDLDFDLVHLVNGADHLFTRWKRRRTGDESV